MMRRACLPLLILFAACDSPTAPDELQQLADARALWQAQGGDSYTYELTRQCFCVLSGRRVTVTVEHGAVVGAEYADLKTPVEAALLTYLQTVPDLFDLIEDAQTRKVASFMASYHAIYGYPTHFEIDYSATTADDEITFTARDLQLTSAAGHQP
jgi:uncharacterized protein DUF6174